MSQVAIKWSGSKRSQAETIVNMFPKKIRNYYEPFLGAGHVFNRLLDSDVSVDRYILSDINPDLIGLWNSIRSDYRYIIDKYYELWNELNKDDDLKRKKDFFKKIRTEFNQDKDSGKFMFIMRTCTNGMPRYNNSGNFNNSFHVTRNGIMPEKLEKIVKDWNERLKHMHFDIHTSSYDYIYPHKDDFIYLDPPYAGTKGMYYGGINKENLWDWMSKLNCRYALSYDGKVNEEDFTYSVPKHLYARHEYIKSGNSSFRRVIGKSKDSIVYESIYLNY